jgi:hypothetical protein
MRRAAATAIELIAEVNSSMIRCENSRSIKPVSQEGCSDDGRSILWIMSHLIKAHQVNQVAHALNALLAEFCQMLVAEPS